MNESSLFLPVSSQSLSFNLDTVDYLLGLCDFTGELMRNALTAASRSDQQRPFAIRDFLRSLLLEMSLCCSPSHPEFGKKMTVFQESLIKVEKGVLFCFGRPFHCSVDITFCISLLLDCTSDV